MQVSVVILAAGFGTRMNSTKAKVLHTICGKTMLSHILDEVSILSDDITVVLNHQAKDVEQSIKTYNVKIKTQDIKNYPGTAGALRDIDINYDRVLILNGDMPLVREKDLRDILKLKADIVVSSFIMDEPHGYGRIVTNKTSIEKIVEEKDASEEELTIKRVNAGVYLLKKEFFLEYIPLIDNNNAQKEYYLTDIVKLGVDRNKDLKYLDVDAKSFCGVNNKYDLMKAEELMLDRIRKRLALEGIIMHLPNTIYIEKDVVFIGESELEPNCVIKGKSTIKNSKILSNTYIEDAYIQDSKIGPFARIRPKSNLSSSHIGNFVELKNSKLNKVKAGHLSYIGDSQIGEGTNLGAGFITCNYDGKQKHKTIIGKNVFVGSATQMVAPSCIEDDVIIGAGTTLREKTVAKGSLVLSKAPIKIIKDFFYKFFAK